jgi:F420-0:gamma-glutamyl ligase-like protein
MAKFISHIKSLKIVLKPAMPTFEGGTKVGDVPGKYALFVDGQFETQDEEIIEKLEAQRQRAGGRRRLAETHQERTSSAG